jgi:hypothetical protein
MQELLHALTLLVDTMREVVSVYAGLYITYRILLLFFGKD